MPGGSAKARRPRPTARLFNCLELGLVPRVLQVVAARNPRRAVRPRHVLTLPVAAGQPAPASGLQGMTPIRYVSATGSTSASIPRAKIE